MITYTNNHEILLDLAGFTLQEQLEDNLLDVVNGIMALIENWIIV